MVLQVPNSQDQLGEKVIISLVDNMSFLNSIWNNTDLKI